MGHILSKQIMEYIRFLFSRPLSYFQEKQLKHMVFHTITGKELNLILGNMPLLKFMNNNDTHNGMTYHTGENEDIIPFNNTGSCSQGGIYVTTLDNLCEFYSDFGNYARQVFIADDALVYVEKNKIKCNKVTLGERQFKKKLVEELLDHYVDNHDHATVNDLIVNNPSLIQFINQKKLTPQIIKNAVKKDADVIRHIDKDLRTEDIILEAVRKRGYLIQWIDNDQMSDNVIMQAVMQNGEVIKWINKNRITRDLIIEAIRHINAIVFIPKDLITDDIRTIIDERRSKIKYYPE